MNCDDSMNDHLPEIKPAESIKKDEVVNTISNDLKLPKLNLDDERNDANLIKPSDEHQLTKNEWENQIAKHILSMYASTNLTKHRDDSLNLINLISDEKEIALENGFVNSAPEDNANSSSKKKIVKKKLKKKKPKKEWEYLTDVNINGKDETIPTSSKSLDDRDGFVNRLVQRVSLLDEKKQGNNPHLDNHEKSFSLLDEDEVPIAVRDESRFRDNQVVRTKDGTEIVVRGPPKCYPIWFVSTGDVYSDWTLLPGSKKLQAQLNVLYEKGAYIEYLGIVEQIVSHILREKEKQRNAINASSLLTLKKSTGTLLNNGSKKQFGTKEVVSMPMKGESIRTTAIGGESVRMAAMGGEQSFWNDDVESNQFDSTVDSHAKMYEAIQDLADPNHFLNQHEYLTEDNLAALWKQLILTSNAMGILAIERKEYSKAIDVLNQAEVWAVRRSEFLPRDVRKELQGHVQDALAYFFYKQKKSLSALSYTKRALENFEKCDNVEGVGMCLLQISAILCRKGEHKEAHKTLCEFLAMVESGRLATLEASPKQLCMVSIGYHNLAVVQLKLGLPDLACRSSQNARKIARLCLSYANRWMHIYSHTHEACLSDMKYELTMLNYRTHKQQIQQQQQQLAESNNNHSKSNALVVMNVKQLDVVKELSEAMFDFDIQHA